MWWIISALAAILIFTSTDLMNKFIVTKEVMDPHLGTVIFSFMTFLVLTPVSLLVTGILNDPYIVFLGLCIGIVSSMGLWFYFAALSREEVSRAIPILATIPLLVLPFGFLFFGESFTLLKYMGIGLVVLGSISLSFKEVNGRFKFDKLIVLVFIAAVMFAARNVLTKLSTQSITIWPVLFWIGVGRGASALALFAFHHPHLRKKARKGAEHLFIVGFFVSLGMLALFTAISLGPVSLVSALVGVKPLLVLVSATLITFLHPSFIRETITREVIIQKTVSTLMIITGATIIVFW